MRSQLPVVWLVGSRWVLERHVHSREDSDLLPVRAQPVKLEELSDRDVDPKPSNVFAVVRPTTPSADRSVPFSSRQLTRLRSVPMDPAAAHCQVVRHSSKLLMRLSASFGLAPRQALADGVISARRLGANHARHRQLRICTSESGTCAAHGFVRARAVRGLNQKQQT